MAKTKQQTSAAKRREQVRQQRQQQNTASNAQSKRRSSRRQQQNNPWPLVGGIVVLVAIVVGVFFYLANQPGASSTQGSDKAYQTITTLSPSLLSQVGTGSAANAMKAIPPNTPLPTGPTGKPQFLYIGAEYCPFCAAQRWAMIVALSRFGKFTQPPQAHMATENNGGTNYPTFTFLKSSYSSQYIDFVAVETQDNNGKTLQTPTDAQTKLINTYDAPPYTSASAQGSIPFIMIGNKYVSSGSYYQPDGLVGKDYQDIANQIKDPNTDLSRGVLGSANYLTAAICQLTKDQPASVCNDTAIQQIEQSLPKAALEPANAQVALAGGQLAMIARRQD
ncbi:MAG TPA: DUF929 family protein [Ktedonobacteraceae bacterium]|nr:DUF929 family protein [Ktedonobacteraceae bacterium]